MFNKPTSDDKLLKKSSCLASALGVTKFKKPNSAQVQPNFFNLSLTEDAHFFQIFVEGMYKYLNLSKDIIDRIFPCIDQLIDIHFRLLEELRIRQNEQPVMSTLADILLRQFSGD